MAKAQAEKINPADLIYPQELFTFTPEEYPSEDIFQANIKALEKTDPELAQKVNITKLPDNYIASITADGKFNYKIVQDNNTSLWLGLRSAPICGATADNKRLEDDQCNYAINGFGDGYNIAETLKKFLPYQAIFVLESNLFTIRANLHIHDLSEYITAGQLVIISGDDPFEVLINFTQAEYGYQRIQKSLICHHKTEQQNNVFNTKLTAAVEKSLQVIPEINNRISKQAAESFNTCSIAGKDPITISSIPCNNSFSDAKMTADILNGFSNLGAEVHHNSAVVSPRETTPYYILEKASNQKPDALLLYNSFRSSGNSISGEFPVINVIPEISKEAAEKLSTNTTRKNDVVVCPASCFSAFEKQQEKPHLVAMSTTVNCSTYKLIDEPKTEFPTAIKDVIMITNRMAVDHDYYNIVLNTYIQLLNVAYKNIFEDPASYNAGLTSVYFESAHRKTAAKLNDKKVKDSLTDILAAAAEGLVQDSYGNSLIKNGIGISIIDKVNYAKNDLQFYQSSDEIPETWNLSPIKDMVIAKANDSAKLNQVYNSAKIAVFTHTNGAITQDMLNAAAAGLLVMTKTNPKDRQPDGLSKIFEPGKEIITYTTCDDLCRKVRNYLENEDKRRAITDNAISKIETEFDIKILCGKILDVIKKW